MKVVEDTREELILEDTPTFLAAMVWFMGLLLLALAITGSEDGPGVKLLLGLLGLGITAMAWHFFPFQRITFSRTDAEMVRRIARITGANTDSLAIPSIERAASQGNWSDGTRMERVVLLTADGPYPLEFGYSGTSRKPVIDAINQWLEAEDPAD